MNKFVLLLTFFLTINICYCDESIPFNEDTIYNYVVDLLKGLSNKPEHECSNIVKNNKKDIMKIAKDLIGDLKNGKKLNDLIWKYGLRLMDIEDLLSKCKLLDLLDLKDQLKSKTGILKYGETIYNHADTIAQYLTEAKNASTMDEKMIKIGQILAIILDFYVN